MASWGAAEWTAFAALAQSLITTLIAILAFLQIRSNVKQMKRWKTLDICNQYDVNPILDESLRRLRDAQISGNIMTNPAQFKIDICNVLNYLDGISIGVEQNLYIEALARDHLETQIKDHFEDYLLDEQTAKRYGLERKHYHHLENLYKRWCSQKTNYRDSNLS